MVKLSNHARQRISERCSLIQEEVWYIFQTGKFLEIFNYHPEVKNEISAKLFYSILDEDTFVAIQNRFDGNIITVLTNEIAESQGWMFGEEDKKVVREIFFGESVPIAPNLLIREEPRRKGSRRIHRRNLSVERQENAEYWVHILVDVTNIPTEIISNGSYTFSLGEFPRIHYPSLFEHRMELVPMILSKIEVLYDFKPKNLQDHLKRILITPAHCSDQRGPLLMMYPEDFNEVVSREYTIL